MTFPLLFLLPIVVVDVSGDRLDPAHTRELVEHELTVTAVAPDDPRAANADGRIDVTTDAATKKMTVRYRKLDEPVERTIDLPADRARAETHAALLAGNLARDEAGELTPAKRRPPVPSIADTLSNDDDRRVRQLHAFLAQATSGEKESTRRVAVLSLGIAGAMIAPAVYIAAEGNASAPAEAFAGGAAVTGGALATIGVLALLLNVDPYEPLQRSLRENEARGISSTAVLENVEKEWANRAESAKRARVAVGWVTLGSAAAFLTLGGLNEVSRGREGDFPGSGITSVAAGGMGVVTGIASLAIESPMERSYKTWRALNPAAEDRAPTIAFGAAPLPGGGGAASLALTF